MFGNLYDAGGATAGMAAMQALLEERHMESISAKADLFKSLLVHPLIKEVHSFGLWMAIEFDSFETCKKVIDYSIEQGVITDWFLFAPHCMRIAPPLNISTKEIEAACDVIIQGLDELYYS